MDKKLLQRRRFLIYAGLASLGLGSAAITIQSSPRLSIFTSSEPSTKAMGSSVGNQGKLETSVDEIAKASDQNTDKTANKTVSQKLPEFRGISQWLNSAPLSVESLQGYVVMIQF